MYGVEIPNYNGKAGMANLILKDNVAAEFNLEHFYQQLAKQLPAYAIPVFLRFSSTVDKTDTFKHKKQQLKQEAYRPNLMQEEVYLLNNKHYEILDAALLKKIEYGKFRI